MIGVSDQLYKAKLRKNSSLKEPGIIILQSLEQVLTEGYEYYQKGLAEKIKTRVSSPQKKMKNSSKNELNNQLIFTITKNQVKV